MHFEMCTHRVHKMLKPDKKIDYIDMHMYSDRKHLLMCVSMYQCTENCLTKDGIHCPCQQNNGVSR